MMASKLAYTLHYWPSIPGRGEFVRLAFESVAHPYKESHKLTVQAFPNHFACPVLEVKEEGKKDSDLISQTPAILSYLAPILNLDGIQCLKEQNEHSIAIRRAQVVQLTLTALDLNNAAHDTHHPIATNEVFEDQREEAIKNAANFRSARLPKFFTHFETTLKNNQSHSGWLIGEQFTIADLTLFHLVDGLRFAFPKRMNALEKEGAYTNIFTLHTKVSNIPNIANYLKSDRRRQYSNGIFRHYPELDGEN